jgi:peptidoglycan LD-endopeptidase LytH
MPYGRLSVGLVCVIALCTTPGCSRGRSAVRAPSSSPAPVAEPGAERIVVVEAEPRLPPPMPMEGPPGEPAGPKVRPPRSSYVATSHTGGELAVPVAGVAANALRDTYNELRGSTPHRALDIAAKRGTPVLAVEEGRIRKLFTSDKGGFTIYQFDPTGKLCYYYAHLDGYADGLREGDLVRRGEVIGYVGTSGNAPVNAPHLHFEVTRVGPEGQWYGGEPLNPYPMMTGP